MAHIQLPEGIPGIVGPMAFSPQTGLVYIPGAVNSRMYHSTPDYAPVKGKQLAGVDMNDFAAGVSPAGAKITSKGNCVKAWDPVAQKEVWRMQFNYPWNGGTLATAGNLVFQGNSMGEFAA